MFSSNKKTDSQIQNDIKNEIKWDPSITASEINVSVDDGIVTLRGSVPHYFEKSLAEKAAQRIFGVRAVADEIEVNMMGSYERSDEQIAEAILSAFSWNYSVPKDIQITVEKGWVTLNGEANWDYQRIAATNAANQLMGVRGVSNYISLKTKVQPSDIKTRIEEALTRYSELESHKIKVSIDGETVTLSGTVHSMKESKDAKMAAWRAPGVQAVKNNINVSTTNSLIG